MSYFVPTRFVWRFGGRQVHLCGSFTRWVETVPMAPVDGSPGVFAVVVHLPPGYHQYKFIVDGKWRHDETAPFMPDPLGNVNNWLFVRRIEPAPSALSNPLGFDPQLVAAQQVLQAAQQQAAQQAAQQLQQLHPALATAPVVPQQHPAISAAALPHTGPLPSGQQQQPDVDMGGTEAVVPPIVIHNPKEPEYTRKKISDFLHSHTAYELIPESGKVVVLDMDLPVRQAFHALHEQGTASAPLWDPSERTICGVISASDFINILRRLRHSVSSGANPMSEVEMDAHTIRGLREEAGAEGREPKRLVYVMPDEDLAAVVARLAAHKCSMAPILTADPAGEEPPHVLHLATLSGVLACLMRHFRASLASLPLLSQPLGSLPLGTWSPDAAVAHTDFLPDSKERRQWRKLQPLHTVTLSTPLTTALSMLLETGVSALPVVDDKRCLVDVYARSQITDLCKGNAYNRLQWEDVTVGQGLLLSQNSPVPWSQAGPGTGGPAGSAAALGALGPASSATGVAGGVGGGPHGMPPHAHVPPPGNLQQLGPLGMGGLSAEFAQHAASSGHLGPGGGGGGGAAAVCSGSIHDYSRSGRVWVCTKDDTLRTVVERLAVPGVRRLIVVHPDTRRVEGLISLSDVAQYLFL